MPRILRLCNAFVYRHCVNFCGDGFYPLAFAEILKIGRTEEANGRFLFSPKSITEILKAEIREKKICDKRLIKFSPFANYSPYNYLLTYILNRLCLTIIEKG